MYAYRKETIGLVLSIFSDEDLQLLGSWLRQVDKLDTHLKQILRQSLGINNTRTGFYYRIGGIIFRQIELHIDKDVQHHAEWCLIFQEQVVHHMLVTTELHTTARQVKNQGNACLTTRGADLTGYLRFDTEVLPVTAQVLTCFIIKIYRYHDSCPGVRASKSNGNLCCEV
jgi:hypothetical protein